MANILVFGNYVSVVSNMPICEFRAPNVVSKKSKILDLAKNFSLKLLAKTEDNLSFGLKPDFRSGLCFGLKL